MIPVLQAQALMENHKRVKEVGKEELHSYVLDYSSSFLYKFIYLL